MYSITYLFYSQKNNVMDKEYLLVQKLRYLPCKRSEIWRFLSYMLIHSSLSHLISNVLMQIFLGASLQIMHNWWRILLVYFAGGLAGCLGNSFFTPDGNLCGSSAGVFALLFGHIADIILVTFYNLMSQLSLFFNSFNVELG